MPERSGRDQEMHVVVSHENADFDAIASMLAVTLLRPETQAVLPERLNRNVLSFLTLYRSGLPFVTRDEVKRRRIQQVVLVDSQKLPSLKGLREGTPVEIIAHHAISREFGEHETTQIEEIGATTTLLVEALQEANRPLTSLQATLLALGIYDDTGSLVYRQTTPRDLRAAAWLVEQGAVLDNVRRFLEPPLNEEQQALLEILIQRAESRVVQGYSVLVATATLNAIMPELNAVAHRLRDALDPTAVFLLIEMPGMMQLVCRSTDDSIDVGAIAEAFGGGGHVRAAAALVKGYTLKEAVDTLWRLIQTTTRPSVRVADLMSHGVHTVRPDEALSRLVSTLRRIGHEGYPVVENGHVIGLLTRRDLDRAVEHGLGDLSVRDVMNAGETTLSPEDSVAVLEQKMVESGWGQIPVVAHAGRKLIGIVTRTDLIKHWAKVHPSQPKAAPVQITLPTVAGLLGERAARIIEIVGERGREQGVNIYMVGGVVRDLMLGRGNLDIDFVVEGDAIAFAQGLQETYGGGLTQFRPFATAKWQMRDLTLPLEALDGELPDHVDFATSRNEFYERPTALPNVYSSSIKLDLARRDFTINTLAVQISPVMGNLLDFFGGAADLDARLIRVLHNLSFVDDPTRILRAVRFERRLDFRIEQRTAELLTTALPMLRRVTGERIRNELTLLLLEADPAGSLALMQERGILTMIHPDFAIDGGALASAFQRVDTPLPTELAQAFDRTDLLWLMLLATLPGNVVVPIADRLLFSKSLAETAAALTAMRNPQDVLHQPGAQPSNLSRRLHGVSDLGLAAAWLVFDDSVGREHIERFVRTWRHIRPHTNGNDLRNRGLRPGPCFRVLLDRLGAAWMDGEVASEVEETSLLDRLLASGICDDQPERG
ncbi:MAG: CBS domain-containing protein [Chloroflexi bacterium]|nr:CBS domain-containing protein [Chloroflexota bacterium]